jgi:hypothetical protein
MFAQRGMTGRFDIGGKLADFAQHPFGIRLALPIGLAIRQKAAPLAKMS